MKCPRCGSDWVKKNGSVRGVQKHQCNDCKRQFVENPKKRVIRVETWEIVDKLLLERLAKAGIARVTGVSERHLQRYVNRKFASEPREVKVMEKAKGALVVEADELQTFCGNRQHKWWLWLALDRNTREIVGCHLAARDRVGARGLWNS